MDGSTSVIKFHSDKADKRPRVQKEERRRVPIACQRCQQKKRRCDGKIKCVLCIRAKVDCVYENKSMVVRNYTNREADIENQLRDDIEHLKQEITKLEKINHELSIKNSKLEEEKKINSALIMEEKNKIATEKHLLLTQHNSLMMKAKMIEDNTISEVDSDFSGSLFTQSIANLLYRKADDSDEYIGSFAIISIVKSIRKRFLGGDISIPESPPVVLDNFINEDATIPQHVERGFLDKFLSLSHNRYYFIESSRIINISKRCYNDRSSWENFCFFIALGIGCRLTELQKVTIYPAPEFYLKKSLKELINAELDPMQQIQACALISLFIGRSYHLSFFITSWELLGIALRKLVQYGFHRKQQITLERCIEYEFHKRLFWSVFGYEKLLSLSLGRPCALSESFVDVPYPVSYELPLNPTQEHIYMLYKLQLEQESNKFFKQPISCFTALIETTNVRNIEGRIHLLYYSTNDETPVQEQFEKISNDIDNWYKGLCTREEFDSVMKGRESYDYFQLLYYRVQLILYIPQLMRTSGTERSMLLDKACIAAGGICTCYKNLYRELILEFSVVALHTVFLAGVIMVYYLHNKGYPSFMRMQSSIRACISLLFVFSERWTEAISYRDLFDSILEQAEKHRQNSSIKKDREDSSDIQLKDPKSVLLNHFIPHNFSSQSTWLSSPFSVASNMDTPIPNFGLEEDFWDKILQESNNDASKV